MKDRTKLEQRSSSWGVRSQGDPPDQGRILAIKWLLMTCGPRHQSGSSTCLVASGHATVARHRAEARRRLFCVIASIVLVNSRTCVAPNSMKFVEFGALLEQRRLTRIARGGSRGCDRLATACGCAPLCDAA